ncbi:MAG: hypothetical protein GXO55_06270 [Chloroflexi bacterium]|nr:hypothetical protein [Chloroflexota bacterium]
MWLWRRASVVLSWMILLGLLVGCGSHMGGTPTPTPVGWGLPDEEAIRAVLDAEARGVAEKNVDLLMQLWAEDGEVRDARHTPDLPQDDAVWRGRDAIYQRYVHLVFPGNPQYVAHTDLVITIQGDHAVVTSTTHIGGEVSQAGDRWELVKREGRWLLYRLTYNLEPAPQGD